MANWTTNSYVNALLLGSKLNDSNVTYKFSDDIVEWFPDEKLAFAAAAQTWSAVADITFTETTSNNSDFVEYLYNQPSDPGALGTHGIVVNYDSTTIVGHSQQLEGNFNVSGFGWDDQGGLGVGGFGFATIVHEIGHGLGLDHTHSDESSDPHVFAGVGIPEDGGDFDLNQIPYSIMSYNDGTYTKPLTGQYGVDTHGTAGGPMAFDIAAIQYLYGANTTTNSGDTTYTLPDDNVIGTYFTSIWDTGGVDEIVYGGARDVVINLNSATLNEEIGGGGIISLADGIYGGFTIAADFTDALVDDGIETGVIIENAVGGTGNDTITGNGVANDLSGNDGNDTILGGQGDDIISGGSGNDILIGNVGVDTLKGGDGDDELSGNRGKDFFNPGAGADMIDGGTDFDRVWYGDSAAGVTVDLTAGTGSGGNAAGDTYIGIERATGSAGQDTITGTAVANSLKGQGGNDTIYGLDGRDVIEGQDGDDILYGGNSNDVVVGGDGDDSVYGNRGLDRLDGGLGDDSLWGGNDVDYFRFNTQGTNPFGQDTIFDFDDGADRLDVRGVYSTTDASNTADTFADFTITSHAVGIQIEFEAGQIILIDTSDNGMDTSDISAADFVFA